MNVTQHLEESYHENRDVIESKRKSESEERLEEWRHRKIQARKKLKNKAEAGLICRCMAPVYSGDETSCDWCGLELELNY